MAKQRKTKKSDKKLKVKKCLKKKKSAPKRKQNVEKYTQTSLDLALKAVKNGMTLRKAQATFGIPLTTIHRHFNDTERKNWKIGPPTILTPKEESEIASWITYRAERGFPTTKTELLDCVQKYMLSLKKKNPFNENRPGRHWYEGFIKRHPTLSLRTAQHLTLNRAFVTKENLTDWFKEVDIYLRDKNLLNLDASRVFNCDESNFLLCPKSEKVLTNKGAKCVYKIIDASEKESMTALLTYSADGSRAPPMILYSYKKEVPKSILVKFPDGWGIGLSESGWMTTETFYEYIANVFYPWLVKNLVEFPVILYLDNHASHVTLPLVRFCREKKIEIISLYPNATHIIQPLDVALFHALKETWKKTVPRWKLETKNTRLRKEDFSIVLKLALDSLNNEKTIIQNGFKTCGLLPFDVNAVQLDCLEKGKKKKRKDSNEPADLDLNETAEVSVETNEGAKLDEHPGLLEMFNKSLPADLLQQFQNCETNKVWTGRLEDKSLFYHWLKIKTMNGIFIK